MCITFVVILIIEFGIDDILFRIKAADGILSADLFIGVPICTGCLLLIHLFKVYKFIIYNKKLVMVESVIFLCIFEMSIEIIDGLFFKTCIFCSILSNFYVAFVIRKLFPSSYKNFENKIEEEYDKIPINKRIDMVITTVIALILVTPTLIFIFMFF